MSSPVYIQSKQLVSVDCAVFGYENEVLKLLLFRRGIEPSKGDWSLPGGWVNDDESVEEAARRVLFLITGLKDIFLEQVQTFSNPTRDPGGRVISILFYALISIDKHDRNLIKEYDAHWWQIGTVPKLIFDHDEMVEKALEKLRFKASLELTGNQLLPETFTFLHLRKLYNAIFQREFDPGNFRKKVLSLEALERLKVKNTTESKRGAYYYRFKDDLKNISTDRIVKINN
jgi:ADP-ribose pyrophosphatase YjhB (NUDIX family)